MKHDQGAMFCFELVAAGLNLLFTAENFPVCLCEVLQVVLVEVLITRRPQ